MEDVNSDINANLSDGAPARNRKERALDTEPEDSEVEANDTDNDEEETGGTENVDPFDFKQFNIIHCRAIFTGNKTKENPEGEHLICGKLLTDCKQHKGKRRKGDLIREGKWYPKVASLKSKDGNGHPVQHGQCYNPDTGSTIVGLTTEELNQHRRQLDHIPTSDDDYSHLGTEGEESEADSEGNTTEGEASDVPTDMESIKRDFLRMGAELKALQELMGLDDLPPKPKKKPTPTKAKGLPSGHKKMRPSNKLAPPIARKKTVRKTAKQVTIGEEHNTAKSPPKPQESSSAVRKLDGEMKAAEDKQEATTAMETALIAALTQVTTPLL